MLSNPLTMLKSFYAAGVLSMIYILLFGIIGVYGSAVFGVGTQNITYLVAQKLGIFVFCIVDIVFITSSLAAIDSCLVSTARVVAIDMLTEFRLNFPSTFKACQKFGVMVAGGDLLDIETYATLSSTHMTIGRIAVFLMSFVGTLPLISDLTALSATTVSGTVIMGLGPPIYLMMFWKRSWGVRPFTFIASWLAGFVIGVLFQVKVTEPATGLLVTYLSTTFMNIGKCAFLIFARC